jgi:hypothetical protein
MSLGAETTREAVGKEGGGRNRLPRERFCPPKNKTPPILPGGKIEGA